jgi:hypothetical protein
MSHRIREAMRSGRLAPMGSAGTSSVVEADETFIVQGRRDQAARRHTRTPCWHLWSVAASCTFHGRRGGGDLAAHRQGNIARVARHDRHAATYYSKLGGFAGHGTVAHSHGEYVRYNVGPVVIHTNSVEGFFSIFKRGMKGIYQHCSEKHLHRYLAEFEFRYSNRIKLGVDDQERAARALAGVKGKRLTYRTTRGEGPATGSEDEIPF